MKTASSGFTSINAASPNAVNRNIAQAMPGTDLGLIVDKRTKNHINGIEGFWDSRALPNIQSILKFRKNWRVTIILVCSSFESAERKRLKVEINVETRASLDTIRGSLLL
jgi:hypothetical protein